VKVEYHRSLTVQALGSHFSPKALETVIAANLGQDVWWFQFGHDHFHYDNNSFASGDAYLAELHRSALEALQCGEPVLARQFLGRLTHAAQDFYAHSTYITLWLENHPGAAPEEIDPLLAPLFVDPRLRSGRVYYPLEILAFIPLFKPWVLPFLPRDSHAWLNLDDPSRPNFAYAFAAAVKRTRLEYERLCRSLNSEQIHQLTDL